MKGITVIIIGGCSGAGYQTVLMMAKRGAKIIIGCKNIEKGHRVKQSLIEESGNKKIAVKFIDLGSLASVRKFTQDINRVLKKLHILINNVAHFPSSDVITSDGLQIDMQINYFGPFLLTISLIDLLKRSAPSRIIIVSSPLAKQGKIDLDNLNHYSGPMQIVSRAKLCLVLFTKELADKLSNTGISAYCVESSSSQPTILNRHLGTCLAWRVQAVRKYYIKSCQKDANTMFHLAAEKDLEAYSGKCFHNSSIIDDYKNISKYIEVKKHLWKISECLVDVSHFNTGQLK